MTNPATIAAGFDPRKTVYATVGAGYAAVDAVNELISKARSQAELARTDLGGQVTALRERLTSLQTEVPDDLAELREKLSYTELRRTAEGRYADYAERGASELSGRPGVEEQIDRVESLYKDVVDQLTKLTGRATEPSVN